MIPKNNSRHKKETKLALTILYPYNLLSQDQHFGSVMLYREMGSGFHLFLIQKKLPDVKGLTIYNM